MSGAPRREDHTRLDGFELGIFKLVRKHSTLGQWREWLRVPLEHAAAKGDMDLFTRLMDAGADENSGWWGCHGRTLLDAAAHCRSKKMVLAAVLKAGVEGNVDVKFGAQRETALHIAAARGAEQACNALMLVGENPNVLNGNKQSPLHLAAQSGHDGVVSTLMLKGADPNERREYSKRTPLHLAAEEGHTLCVSKLVVGGAEKDSRSKYGVTPLHLAARCNRLGAVEELLAAGANLDIRAAMGPCALDTAARWGHAEIVRALLACGGKVQASELGYTALHSAAARADNGDVILVLLEAGADIEAKTTSGVFTPLGIAVSKRKGSSGTIRALLEGGANVNARSTFGITPLHGACSASSVGAVELLLRWGADETLARQDGETAGDVVGAWEQDSEEGSDEEDSEEADQRKADDERIRHMLARAPADKSWRRRGWLVLARSRPAKVQLALDSGGGNGSSAKTAKASYGDDDKRSDETAGLVCLVSSVVNLDVEGLFRLVVGFL